MVVANSVCVCARMSTFKDETPMIVTYLQQVLYEVVRIVRSFIKKNTKNKTITNHKNKHKTTLKKNLV